MRSILIIILSLLLSGKLSAQYNYTLSWLGPNSHLLRVTVEVSPHNSGITEFRIPTWRPGRYIMQDYAAAVLDVSASDENGNPLAWHKMDKDTWAVEHGQIGKVRLEYSFYANNQDAGSSYYGDGQVYFNPVNLFMYLPGKYLDSVRLNVPDLPQDWKVATALKREGPTIFSAASYHEFADSPTVFARDIVQLSFEQGGAKFYLHFQGDYQGDKAVDEAILETVRNIVAEQAAIFGGMPFEAYHFIYRLLPYRMRHAVEHSFSSSFTLPSTISANPTAARNGIMGITAHEFWHAWNVKRIRPAALWPYDYAAPQYTGMHWFTEGVTEYMTHLTLMRTGLIDQAEFLKRLSNSIAAVENSYAAKMVSPSSSSFDSWLSPSPYSVPARQVSYYTLGARLGLMIDLKSRASGTEGASLDELFAYLYSEFYQEGLGIREDGIARALEVVTGESWVDFFAEYVDGTGSPDYGALIQPFGLEISQVPQTGSGAAYAGVIRFQAYEQGIYLQQLNPIGDAFLAGFADEDLILTLNGEEAGRIELDAWVDKHRGDKVSAVVFRDGKRIELRLDLQGASAPRDFILSPIRKPSSRQKEMWKAWTSSLQ